VRMAARRVIVSLTITSVIPGCAFGRQLPT
jgi:hypothetical protein